MNSQPDQNGHARDILAPLYGEAPTLGPGESAAFEATRDLIGDHMRPGRGEVGLSPAARNRVLDTLQAEPAAKVGVLAGSVWVRRAGAASALPLGDDREVRRGDTVLTPPGSRAMVRLADGSAVMLAEQSELVIGAPVGIAERLSLLGGRLYAWVEKQRDAVFAIRTPQGFACVVGTEFDLQSDREGNLALIVTEGQVNYRPASAAGQEVALRRNEMIEHRLASTTKRTLSNRETARLTEWARPRRRGNITWTVAGLVALALLAGVGVMWFAKRGEGRTLPPPPALTASTPGTTLPPAAAPAPAATSDNGTFDFHYLQPGGEKSISTSRLRSELEGIGPVEYVMSMRAEFAPGGGSARLRIEDGDVLKQDGTSVEGPQNHYKTMRGLEFTLTRDAKGLLANPRSEREDKSGSDAFTMLMMTMTLNSQPKEKLGLKPGDTWRHEVSGDFALMPGTTWTSSFEFKLDGFGELDGRPVAYITSRGTMKVKDGVLNRTTTPAYTQNLVAKTMVIESSGRAAYDRATSRLLVTSESSSTDMDLEMRIMVKDREPIVRPISKFNYKQAGTIDTKYLD